MTHAELTKKYCPLTGNKCLGKECAKCEKVFCELYEPMCDKFDSFDSFKYTTCSLVTTDELGGMSCDKDCPRIELKCGL